MSKKRKKILLSSGAIICYYILFQSLYNMISSGRLYPYEGFGNMMFNVALNFTPILFIFLLNYFIVFRLVKIKNIQWKILVDILLSFFMALILINSFFVFILSRQIDWAGTIFNNVFIFLIIEVSFYVQHFRRTLNEKAEAQQRAIQFQHDALRAQVNPHFLFNSLNILNSLISIDPQKSKEFIFSLSSIYRYILQRQGEERVLLREELSFLDSYVDVLKMRYNKQFDVDYYGRENVSNQQIIPFTMQLLIENVTKHNVISSQHPMTVIININKEYTSVTNHIRQKFSETSSNIGLTYITTLYKKYNKEFRVERTQEEFTAIIPYINC